MNGGISGYSEKLNVLEIKMIIYVVNVSFPLSDTVRSL